MDLAVYCLKLLGTLSPSSRPSRIFLIHQGNRVTGLSMGSRWVIWFFMWKKTHFFEKKPRGAYFYTPHWGKGSSAKLDNPCISTETPTPLFVQKERFQINRARQNANALTSHRRHCTGRRPGCHRFSFYVKFYNSSGFHLRCKNQKAKMHASLVVEKEWESVPKLRKGYVFLLVVLFCTEELSTRADYT